MNARLLASALLALCLAPAIGGEIEDKLRAALGARAAAGAVAAAHPAAAEADPRALEVAGRLRAAMRAARGQGGPVIQPAAQAQAPAPPPKLKALAQDGIEIFRRENRTVRQIRGGALESAGQLSGAAGNGREGARERAARRFFAENREALALENPGAELALQSEETGEGGSRHLRFAQKFGGLRVWPAGLSAHFDQEGRMTGLDGAYVPTPVLPALDPALSAAEAAASALARLPAALNAEHDEPELIIHAPLGAPPRLAWKIEVRAGLDQAWRIIIDASTGRLLRQEPRVFDAGAAGSGIDMTGVRRNVNVWQQGADFYLLDTSKPMFQAGFDPIQNPRGVIKVADARNTPLAQLGDVFFVISPSSTAWDVPPAISAAFNFSETYDYFREQHGRNSLDNQGGNITAIVRIGNYDNASWNGNLSIMIFGDAKPYAASLDVVAHELGHGITEKSAGLVYENQSGALNESFSDIFGEMTEARTRGQNDWLMGSELGGAFRNLKNPGALQIEGLGRPYPSKMSEFLRLPNTDDADHGGVHLNSSIINHCFYLLAEGLPEAIGKVDAARIFYRTLTAHLQPQSQFIDCRLGAIASAEALFGAISPQALATARAFDAVEIFAAPETPEPTPVPVVQGADSTLFLYQDLFGHGLGRREAAQGDTIDGSIYITGVDKQRPSVSGDGSFVALVGANNDICIAETVRGNSVECLGFAGLVHNVAVSPDGAQVAFVFRDPATGGPEGRVSVVDVNSGATRAFNLVSPVVDGASVDQVLFADAMSFTTDSRKLMYDAVSRVRFANGPTLDRWSIYALDLATERTEIVIPPLEGIDTGNPAPGRAGNRYLAFEAHQTDTGDARVMTLDLFTGELAAVGIIGREAAYPCFNGDESAVIFAAPNGNFFGTGISLFQQKLGADRRELVGVPSVWLGEAVLGVIYRRGAFSGTNALPAVTLAASATNLPAAGAITLTARASDADGAIQRVEFYNGSAKLGESTAPANGDYTFAWQNAPLGQHRLTARAMDNLGGSADSAPLLINVGGGAERPSIFASRLANGDLRLGVRGTAGNYQIEQSLDLRAWTDAFPIAIGAGGQAEITDPKGRVPSAKLFYRVRRAN